MKKKITVITILLFVAVMCCVLTACADPHEHELQHFEAKEPTCTDEGNIEYWYCAGCGKYFSDETAGKEIAKEKTVLVATGEHDWSEWVTDSESSCTTGGIRHRVCNDCGERQEEALPIGEHNMTHVAAVSATCIDEGNVEYWHCEVCGKNFADEDAEELLEDVVLPLGSHKLEYVEQVSSTCVEAGNMAHWYCEICGKNFADRNAEELLADLSLPLGAHNIVDGKCMVCGIDEIFINGTPGLAYTLNGDESAYIAISIGTATETDIVIASEHNGLPVTSMGVEAFRGCSSLTSITIPDSITSISNSAFRGCTSLTSITIPDSVTSIGVYAFDGCSSLTSITIPDSITRISNGAFGGCTSLTSITIPDSVTNIGWYAFYGCSGLTSITIPEGVTSIGSSAFEGCSGLTSRK